jgi:hypothetical protein
LCGEYETTKKGDHCILAEEYCNNRIRKDWSSDMYMQGQSFGFVEDPMTIDFDSAEIRSYPCILIGSVWCNAQPK